MSQQRVRRRSLARAILRDPAANTIVITAAALIPLIATVGGAVDMSRVYLTHSRLQSACDAGALAARRTMRGNRMTDANKAVGENFFNMNFPEGKYGTEGLSISYSAADDGKVTGTASTTVPMTLMELFRDEGVDVSVSCTADLNLPSTDVMLVLDTTLSMNDPNPGDSVRRIDALTTAVMSFYDTLEGAKPQGVSVRYGFVPYSHTVNVGMLLHRDWIQDTGTYDSREPDGVHTWKTGGGTISTSTWRVLSGTNQAQPRYQVPSENCPASKDPENWSDTYTAWSAWSPSASELPRTRTRIRTRNGTQFSIARDASNNCWITPREFNQYREEQTETVTENPNEGTTNTARHWIYRPIDYDLRPLKGSGAGDRPVSGGTFTAPVNDNQTNRTIRWPDGDRACIEERATRRTNETFLTARHDMDVDRVPDPSDPATQWRPYLPGVVYSRNVWASARESEQRITTNPHELNRWVFSQLPPTSTRTINLTGALNFYTPFGSTFAAAEGACPSPARKMGTINRGQLQSYMGSLRPQGYTYHEIGLLWGLRLISRQGLFASEHAAAEEDGAIKQHMILMVDGQRDTRPFTYSAWGVAATARRRTPADTFPSRTLEDAVSGQRLNELCTVAKDTKGITLWVIAFGTALTSDLIDCASPGRAYEARNAAELVQAFTDIATQMAELRLSQ